MNLEKIINELKEYDGPRLNIMEVCGTHTASIFKNGIRSLLSPQIRLISGPGCPVCVTPGAYIDKAVAWALRPDCVVFTFGDMMKVPGNEYSLSEVKGSGARVELMYSPREVLKKAVQNPGLTFIIACVGFETTIPSYSILLDEIRENNITNIKMLTALRRVMPALHFICDTDNQVDAFIAPGHVSTILGSNIYKELAEMYGKPFSVAGFEAEHVLIAIYDLMKQIQSKKHEVHNLYPSSVSPEGNRKALSFIDRYFEPGKAYWRGIGSIDDSGLYLKEDFLKYDAGSFDLFDQSAKLTKCRCGEVILGKMNPDECPLFRKGCTPVKPQGPCMVSSEGTCGIWYRFASQ